MCGRSREGTVASSTTADFTLKRTVAAVAGSALVAWMAYAAVEGLFEAIVVRFLPLYCTNKAVSWRFIVRLLAMYSAAGVVLGAATGVLLWVTASYIGFVRERMSDRRLASAGLLTLVATVSLAIAVQFGATGAPLALVAIVAVIALVLVMDLVSSTAFRWTAFAVNPWTISVILVGMPWVMRQVDSNRPRFRLAVAAAFVAAVWTVGLVLQLLRSSRAVGRTPAHAPYRGLRLALSCASAVIVASFFVDRAVYPPPPDIASTSGSAPNVILISLDTVRADHLSAYGYERDTTPNLRKLAADATVYTRAVAPSDMTLSTHASMFTGLYPSWHGAHLIDGSEHGSDAIAFPLSEHHVTLAERLQARGYSTAQIAANYWFLGPSWQLHQGFDYYSIFDPSCCVPSPYLVWQRIRGTSSHPGGNLPTFSSAAEVNGEVFGLLESWKHSGRPFFLFVNYMDAHWPYAPPAPFDTKYPGKDPSFDAARLKAFEKAVIRGKREVSEEERRHLVSQYDGLMAYLDDQLDRVVSRLKELEMYDNTLLIVTSDHGEALGERGMFQHSGHGLYQNILHIPLLIRFPGGRNRGVVDEFVSSVDLMPTVLDAIGAEPARNIQGRSLLAAGTSSGPLYAESYPKTDRIKWDPEFRRVERAIFDGHVKYITSTAGKRELYDLLTDPAESTNLYRADDARSQRLHAMLEDWIKHAEMVANAPVKMNQEMIEKLRSLGYVR